MSSKLALCASVLLGVAAGPVLAGPVLYVDWLEADIGAGTASGVINVPDADPVQVDFTATFADGSAGNLFFANVDGGTNYWVPDAPYISTEVSNAPPDSDMLALVGGVNQIYTVTLSEAIKDPVMAIVSLGQPGVPTTYDFDSPFEIVSQGVGYWGGGPDALQKLSGDVLEGREGHGTIQFLGTFSTFSWEVPTPESWHGFTFAVRTTEAAEPGPGPGPGPGPAPNPIPLPPAALSALVTVGGLGGLRLLRRRFWR
jgi:hypothetical protein